MPLTLRLDHVSRPIDGLMLCAVYQKSLNLRCPACQHGAVLAAVPIWWLFERRGWDQSLNSVCKRLYCSACWARRKERVYDPAMQISDDKPTADPFRWPDERTWKRLTSRFRS